MTSATLTTARGTAQRPAQRLAMVPPPERTEHSCFRVTVTAVVELTSHLRRITLASPLLRDYAPLGPDEYFGLLMPPGPGEPLALPRSGSSNLRADVQAMPEAIRPQLRWYTVRAHRAGSGEVDVDVMVHGDEGPGSAWVLSARPGDEAGFQTGSASYHAALPVGEHLVVGDETASPAISAILEQHRGDSLLRVVLEVPGRSWVPELPTASGAQVAIVERGDGPVGSAAVPAVKALSGSAPDFVWICGEQGMIKDVRRQVVDALGVDRRNVYHCAYWILGRPRG